MREGTKKFFQSFKLGRRPRRSFYETVSKSLGFRSKGIGGRELGFDYGLKDSPGLILGKFFPMSRGALSSASPALCRGGAWILKAFPLQKGGGLVMIGSTTQKGGYYVFERFLQMGGHSLCVSKGVLHGAKV